MSGRTTFLGTAFDTLDEQGVMNWIEASASGPAFAYMVTPNVDHIVMLSEAGDEAWRGAYRAAVEEAGLCVNDSRILQRLARLSGIRLPVTPGSDIVRELVVRRGAGQGALALVGGRREEAAWLRGVLPHYRVQHFVPPMGVRDDPAAQDAIARFVAQADADIVLFAIGAPQSEMVCHAIAVGSSARGVGLCIGASVEFLSGTKSRAPRWMQRAGMEWLFRLLSEPRRLARRYLLRGPRVFAIWWKDRRARR